MFKMFKAIKRVKELEELVAAQEKIIFDLNRLNTLVDIRRIGRCNTFVFSNGYKIETMGLLSDDIHEWREKLLK